MISNYARDLDYRKDFKDCCNDMQMKFLIADRYK